MKNLKQVSVAIVSLFASGTLLAQSAPPKPAPKSRNAVVAQAPASGGASSGASAAGGTEAGLSTNEKVAIGVGAAALIAAAASSGGGSSTTTHH